MPTETQLEHAYALGYAWGERGNDARSWCDHDLQQLLPEDDRQVRNALLGAWVDGWAEGTRRADDN